MASPFGPAFVQFFQELKENNNKDWFDANRKTFEQEVQRPFMDFMTQLLPLAKAEDPGLTLMPKDSVFRIYRDVRFSPNKTPYKTHMSAYIARGGRKSFIPGFYLQFGADGCCFGGGAYQLETAQLREVRSEIAHNPQALHQLLADPKLKKLYGSLQGESLKTAPRDFKEQAEQEPMLKMKQFYLWTELPADTVLKNDIVQLSLDYYRTAQPVCRYFATAMGLLEPEPEAPKKKK